MNLQQICAGSFDPVYRFFFKCTATVLLYSSSAVYMHTVKCLQYLLEPKLPEHFAAIFQYIFILIIVTINTYQLVLN